VVRNEFGWCANQCSREEEGWEKGGEKEPKERKEGEGNDGGYIWEEGEGFVFFSLKRR